MSPYWLQPHRPSLHPGTYTCTTWHVKAWFGQKKYGLKSKMGLNEMQGYLYSGTSILRPPMGTMKMWSYIAGGFKIKGI